MCTCLWLVVVMVCCIAAVAVCCKAGMEAAAGGGVSCGCGVACKQCTPVHMCDAGLIVVDNKLAVVNAFVMRGVLCCNVGALIAGLRLRPQFIVVVKQL